MKSFQMYNLVNSKLYQFLRFSGSSVSEGINNGLNTVNGIAENAANGLESIKNITNNIIDVLTPA